MDNPIPLGRAADGTPASWIPSNHLIVTAPARTGGTTLLLRLIEAAPRAGYVNVASAHVPTPPDGVQAALRDDLGGALRMLADPPGLLCVDGMEYWLRGPCEPIENPRNRPGIARWNETMRRAAHLRALWRDRLARLLASDADMRVVLLFRTRDADRLLGRWPVGVTPTRCDRLDLGPVPRTGGPHPATLTRCGATPVRFDRDACVCEQW